MIANAGGSGTTSHINLKEIQAVRDNDPLVIGQGMEELHFVSCTIRNIPALIRRKQDMQNVIPTGYSESLLPQKTEF